MLRIHTNPHDDDPSHRFYYDPAIFNDPAGIGGSEFTYSGHSGQIGLFKAVVCLCGDRERVCKYASGGGSKGEAP